MSDLQTTLIHGVLVDDEVEFTLVELGRACRVDSELLVALVDEGVLTPRGDDASSWRFGGIALQRARAAIRLDRDLELGAAGTALVLDLLDEIESLRARLRRLGAA